MNIFNKSDFKSGDGMLTSVWGPSLWHYLHTMSFNYPIHPTAQQKKHYKYFTRFNTGWQNNIDANYGRFG